MKVVELKCPNCGALVSKDTMKCEYYGANLILAVDGSLAYKGIASCPKCGSPLPSGSWVCLNCGEAVTKDQEALKELQHRLRFEQYNRKKVLPPVVHNRLKPDEYVYSSFNVQDERVYVVTDKRVVKFENEQFSDAPWRDVISVGEIMEKVELFSRGLEFVVHTFIGGIAFYFPAYIRGNVSIQFGPQSHPTFQRYFDPTTAGPTFCERFRQEVIRVLQSFSTSHKDPLIQVCFAHLGQEFEFEPQIKYKDLFMKYAERYPHNPEGVLEFHVDRKMKEGKTKEQAMKELQSEIM